MNDKSPLHTAVFDSLEEQIAVLDRMGTIVEVNGAWRAFGSANGLPSASSCLGDNYLETLLRSSSTGDHLAGDALRGISSVFDGKRESFYLEYPCHSPEEKRWFTMRIVPLKGQAAQGLFVVSHHNITARKLAELKAEELAMHDPLTFLANRRAFGKFFERELRSSIRAKRPLALLIADIDFFKAINDEYGHAAGDQCLILFAKSLAASARRADDLAARLGGDEFALVLGNTDASHALLVAEGLLSAVRATVLPFAKGRGMGTSIGVVSGIPEAGHTVDVLMQRADRALYAAKSAGRDRIHALSL